MSSHPLKIPKQAVRVQIAVQGQAPRTVEVFIAEDLSLEAKRTALVDLLESGEQFLPSRDVSEDVWLLVNKSTIAWVSVPRSWVAEASTADVPNDTLQVSVGLLGAQSLVGELFYRPNQVGGRVIDYLNNPGRFFRVWTSDHVYLVNKQYVVRVLELPASTSRA